MIQFAHIRNEPTLLRHSLDRPKVEGTLVIDTPSVDDLNKLYNSYSDSLLLQIGVSVKSPLDIFEKKIGREHAVKRMSPVIGHLEMIWAEPGLHYYKFNGTVKVNNRDLGFSLILTSHELSKAVRMISCNLHE